MDEPEVSFERCGFGFGLAERLQCGVDLLSPRDAVDNDQGQRSRLVFLCQPASSVK